MSSLRNSSTTGGWLASCLILLSGCVKDTQLKAIDLSDRRGVYVVALVENGSLRRSVEDRLVGDLKARDVQAYASFADIDSILGSSGSNIRTAAAGRAAAAVVLLHPVSRDSSAPEAAPSLLHPNLESFYEYARRTAAHGPGPEAAVEVGLFDIGHDPAELFWWGTAQTFKSGGISAAIPELSNQIAAAMADARKRLLGR